MAKAHLRRFAAYYYNWAAANNRGAVLNYKDDAFPPGAAVLDFERGLSADIRQMPWQTDTAVGKNSWGYVTNMDYKTPGEIIGDLVDIVSKNGNLLLNVGPRGDGGIPQEDENILLEIGKWLDVNGEAIYGTRPWRIYGEGPAGSTAGNFNEDKRAPYVAQDIRFTTRGSGTLYAITLAKPGRDVAVHSLGANVKLLVEAITNVELLGAKSPVKWTRAAGALKVQLPARLPGKHGVALKITVG
jgi:alpha-L-fucosidase